MGSPLLKKTARLTLVSCGKKTLQKSPAKTSHPYTVDEEGLKLIQAGLIEIKFLLRLQVLRFLLRKLKRSPDFLQRLPRFLLPPWFQQLLQGLQPGFLQSP